MPGIPNALCFIGPADCNHHSRNHILFSEPSEFRRVLVQVLKPVVCPWSSSGYGPGVFRCSTLPSIFAETCLHSLKRLVIEMIVQRSPLSLSLSLSIYLSIYLSLYIYIHYAYTHVCMLCYAMLCYAILYYVMLCYAMLCYAILWYVMLCYVMLYYVMLCYVMSCYVMYVCMYVCM